MLDSDLVKFYEVETSYLNRQVKRNFERFNDFDFMFQLSKEEFENLKCQIGTSSWGGKRKLPYVFTEQGVYMLATVINSNVAINITKTIMRTFTKMREFALNYKDVIDKVEELEKTIKITGQQTNYNTEKIEEKRKADQSQVEYRNAFILLNEILKDTKETNKNLIGFEREK